MTLDPLILSRLQFAWVIGWHIVLPAFTVGIASYIALLEGLHLATGRAAYLSTAQFWTRIFAVAFGMGVVTGIVMPFQFGTNWSRLSDAAGNVIGPLLAYEGVIAFFLEAAFLGVLLFGRGLVPRWAHFTAALMVALGTLFSSFWILATNSWMQTPAGYILRDGRFYPADWLAIIFNPSFPYRLAHTVVAFYVTAAFVVLGVGAYTVRRAAAAEEGRVMMTTALSLLAVLVPLQMLIGDRHGLNTREYQPAKLAAIEARWETAADAPLTLFAWPDEARERNDAALDIPELGSLILTHSFAGTVQGLKDFPAADRPPVAIVFFAFRVMVGLALVMAAVVAAGWWLRWRDRLCRGARRLGDDRGRAPAVDRVRAAAHRAVGDAVAVRRRRADLAAVLRGSLSGDLSERGVVHAASGAGRAGRGARGAGRGRAAAPAGARTAGGAAMTAAGIDFVGVWTVLIAAGVFFYVLLDGFDLGVGMLHGFAPSPADRRLIMNAIAPVWDGNETWLVFCGVALIAAFPLAFAIIVPAVYFPILVMLIALAFRGV